jgi:hypothetical protein
MTTDTTLHPLAVEYLKELRRRARDLPRSRREDLVADIEAHLAETVPSGMAHAEARSAIDRLGAPDEIVVAELGANPLPRRRGTLEWSTIILLLAGGVAIPVIGWLAGVVLLWISRTWTLRDKLWGTLVVPGGLLPAVWLWFLPVDITSCVGAAGQNVCVGGTTTAQQSINIAFFAVVLVLPVCTAVYLARRAQRPLGTR